MKHRLALARSLLNRPSLLFLDEPTRSLDPLAAARFREALYTLARREGCTIFLVTHDLEEAVELCDRVGVMVRGQMRIVDDPAQLRALLAATEHYTITVRNFSATTGSLSGINGVKDLIRQATAASPAWTCSSRRCAPPPSSTYGKAAALKALSSAKPRGMTSFCACRRTEKPRIVEIPRWDKGVPG